jgi:DNA-binding response OmpR family regulator
MDDLQPGSKLRALVLEDEPDWRDLIVAVLEALDLEVVTAGKVAEARDLIARRAQDVLVIDRRLGHAREEGLDLLANLPAPPWRPAVLVLSQLGSTEARVHGLDAGADDYLVKPFDPGELRARVQALLRRRTPAAETIISLWGLSIDTKARLLIWDNKRHALGDQGFLILAALMRGGGEAVTPATLWREGWPHYARLDPAEPVIQVAISRLRARLVELTGQRWVHGVRGRGYRLAPDHAA